MRRSSQCSWTPRDPSRRGSTWDTLAKQHSVIPECHLMEELSFPGPERRKHSSGQGLKYSHVCRGIRKSGPAGTHQTGENILPSCTKPLLKEPPRKNTHTSQSCLRQLGRRGAGLRSTRAPTRLRVLRGACGELGF